MLHVGSLFSGAGLCDLGFHQAGFIHRFFCEADPFCRSILARHWPGVPIFNDVRTFAGADALAVNVLVGGFPCQDVSCSGGRAGITQKTRSGLWYEYRRLIEEIRPRYAVIENVKGLLSKGMEIVLSDLSALGYDAEWESLPAAAFGAPHLRDRVFIVAYPHRGRVDAKCGVLAPLKRELESKQQPWSCVDWLGIRIERPTRAAIRKAYGGCVLRRVDDGSAAGLDQPGRAKSGQSADKAPDPGEHTARVAIGRPPGVLPLSQEERRAWLPMLRALGNGVAPAQGRAVARCILKAEGLI